MNENLKRIEIENLSKTFKIGFKKLQGTLSRVYSIFSGREPKKIVNVLSKISLSLYSGEILGLIGENGSGKSTLLRCIAGIYEFDSGNMSINGKVIPLINLNIGMQYRLSMKDNIYLIGSLFGMSKEEIDNEFNSIVEFSGLSEYTETKLYQFSNGMLQRLAFSIAIHSKPDILLLDEVFEVGDEDFKKKSSEKIKSLVRDGSSVILVTHELLMVQKYCTRAVWLKNGEIHDEGETKKILKEYKKIIL